MPTLASFNLVADLWSIVRPSTPAAKTVEATREASHALRSRSDADLRALTAELRTTARGGVAASPFALMVPVFALVAEATRRVHGIELFDAQIQAGIAMARGAIAEMATGEGKTLAAAAPAMFLSLRGEGVHLATPNAYLAQRDFEKIGPILKLLGTSVGLVPDGVDGEAKRAAYACDVTYATGYELGFDYLRDRLRETGSSQPGLGDRQLALLRGQASEQHAAVQSRRGCAIIDEIDSVLIDEACLPLVLSQGSGPANGSEAYREAQRVATSLRPGSDFIIDPQTRTVALTHAGISLIHENYQSRLRFPLERPWSEYIEQAIASQHVHRRDVDYVVQDGRVMLVDEFTGRIFADRTWRDGLHQAIEAKEGLMTSPELRTAARISRQRFFRLYRSICGMTGTAYESRIEFQRQFDLRVSQIPLRLPSQRQRLATRYFVDVEAKYRAIVAEVLAFHHRGQPVLIGSRTIQNSERLAELLAATGIPFALLNGRQDRAEAEIVARAGHRGAVTIATNMAGRGTDIVLGPAVAALGGMHVIGVEHHESARIDQQLLGRAGRQGDPGSGRFYVSADDALLLRFSPQLSERMRRMAHGDGEIGSDLSAGVLAAQRAAEKFAYRARRRMLAHDRQIDEMLRVF